MLVQLLQDAWEQGSATTLRVCRAFWPPARHLGAFYPGQWELPQRGGKDTRSICKEPAATSLRPLNNNVVNKSTEESSSWVLRGVDQRARALSPTSCGCQTKPPVTCHCSPLHSLQPPLQMLSGGQQQKRASRQLLTQHVLLCMVLMSLRGPLVMAGESQHALVVVLLVEGDKSKTRAGIWPRTKRFALSALWLLGTFFNYYY